MDVCISSVYVSKKRKVIAISLMIGILAIFWSLSRYPDLIAEYDRSKNNTLVERNLGNLSKDEMLKSRTAQSNLSVALTTAINWIDTNKIGMSFGIFFAAAILLALQQSRFLHEKTRQPGVRGAFAGLLLGTPLGVCTNCATPVSLGLSQSGASKESAFATLIASPSLNPIGLLMIFYLFPWQVGTLRVVCLSLFILIGLPLWNHLLKVEEDSPIESKKKLVTLDESWLSALSYCQKSYLQFLILILRKVLPPMLIIGVIAAFLVAYYPMEGFLLVNTDTYFYLFLAAFIGVLLPMPMFVDIVLVWFLSGLGLPLSLTVTLMLTLAPFSFFAFYVMGRNVSWRLSIAVLFSILLIGMSAGIVIHHKESGIQLGGNMAQFEKSELSAKQAMFDNKKLSNFFAGGISVVDFNNDGYLDIFVAGKNSSRLYKNQGDGTFIDVTKSSGISDAYNTVAGMWADYDNDGFADLLLVNYQDANGRAEQNILYHNNGDGTFRDVSSESGLIHKDYSSSAAWADIDNDGDLDLFISNFGKLHLSEERKIVGQSQFDRLYRNDNGHFVEIAQKAGVAGKQQQFENLSEIDKNRIEGERGFSFQPVWFDFNNDGLIDLFVASDFGNSQLYKNNGDNTFTNMSVIAGIKGYGTGMGVVIFDANQDGLFDIYQTNIKGNKLWLNTGRGNFVEAAEKYGIEEIANTSWGVAALDTNNDMNTEVFIINGLISSFGFNLTRQQAVMADVISRNNLYWYDKNAHKYINVTKQAGLFNYAMGRGLAVGDLNNDGAIDMVVSNRNDDNVIVYKNKAVKNNFIKIKLIGHASNRMAIGAKVSLYVGDTVQHKLVSAGNSFLSQSATDLLFGLGHNTKVDKIVIKWPSGQQQTLHDIKGNRLLTIEEKK